MNQPRDKGLNGNEKIEQAVAALQQEPTQEQLAHTLTVIRRRIKEHGQLVVAVEPNLGSEQMQLRAIRTADGASWWYASRPCSFTRSPLNTSPANRSRKSKNKTGDCCKIKMR